MTLALFEIPLQPSRPQNLTITLAGVTYQMFLQWRDAGAGFWIMDLFDENRNLLLAGQALVPGTSIMGQYPDIGFPGYLVMICDGGVDAMPTFDDLGVSSHLYFVTGTP